MFSNAIDASDTQDGYEVLMWYGVGGQGKSALLREFQRIAATFNEAQAEAKSKRQLIPAKVDFDDERLKRVDAALYSIRRQLAQNSGGSFHTFDTAFITYHSKTRPGADVGAAFPELFKGEKEGMMDLIDVLDGPLSVVTDLASAALPGANLLYKWGARLTGKLASWWSSRGNELLAGIEQLQPEQLLERLPTYLGIDLCDNIKANPDKRPVILLDTYEALWAGRGQKDGLADRRTDAWVRLLVQDAPGTLFVIAGRDKLQWGEIDEVWNEVIDAHLLGGLSDEDATAFLTAVPIPEEDVRKVIIASSNGLPFYLDLQVSTYEAIREQDQMPTADKFGGTPSDILARFLEHLSDADQGALRLASYLQFIMQPMMDGLVEAFPGRTINYSFARMVARSSFEEISDNTYEIHALMKVELQRREREEHPDRYKATHQWLFEWFDGKIIRDQHLLVAEKEERLLEIDRAIHHLRMSQDCIPLSWVSKLHSALEESSDWGVLADLYAEVLSTSSKVPDWTNEKEVQARNNWACVLSNGSRTAEAQEQFTTILKAFSDVGSVDPIIKNLVRMNMMQNLIQMDDITTAVSLMDAIDMTAFQGLSAEVELKTEIDRTSAHLMMLQDRYKEAEKLLRSLATKELANLSYIDAETSVVLADLSHVIRLQDRFEEAETIFQFSVHAVAHLIFGEQRIADSVDVADEEKEIFENHHYIVFNGSSEPLLRKTSLDWFPRTINSDERRKVFYAKELANLEAPVPSKVAEVLTDPLMAASMSERHPNSDPLLQEFITFLSSFPTGARIRVLLDKSLIKIIFFCGELFDCRFENSSKTILVRLPKYQDKLNLVGNLAVYGGLYQSAVDRAGLIPPTRAAGLVKIASYHHGLNIDILTELAKSYEEWDTKMHTEFLSIASSATKEVFEAFGRGAAREDLYQIYADGWER